MATGRRGNPVLRPYERQQTIGGQLSPRADVHYQKNYIGETLEKLANLTDNIYRSMEQDKFDKYERDIDTAKEDLYLKIQSTQNPDDWYKEYKAYKQYKEEHGKELLGDTLYNKWLGDSKHGYGSKERDDLDFQMRIVPKVLDNAKKLRVEDATQMLTKAVLESNPEKAKSLSVKAMDKLDDENLFTVAEREQNKNETPKIAYANAYSSLLEKSPEKALALVETKEFQDAIKDPSEVEKYRNNAQNAVISFRTNRDFQDIVQKEGRANNYLQQILSGELRSVGVIENDPTLTRPQKDILIKCMGERISKSGKGIGGAGIEGVSELEVLTKIKMDFDNLLATDSTKSSGYRLREAETGTGIENESKYNEIRLQKLLELRDYIREAWESGYISTDSASTRINAIQLTLSEFNTQIINGKKITEENLSSNSYESGLVTLNNTFKDYGIIDPVEKNDYELRFFKNVDKYLQEHNLTANDFVNLPKAEKDAITLNIASGIIKDMVNYNKFFERIPNARGQSSNSIVAGAKKRYAEKVRKYNESLKIDNWAFFSYDSTQEERLRDLASEAYREEIEAVTNRQKNIDTEIKAQSLLQALERQENEEFLSRLVTAKEEELKKIKPSIPKIGVITPTGKTATLYYEKELAIEKEYAEKSESLRLLKEGDEKAIQEAIDDQENLEKYILEQLG